MRKKETRKVVREGEEVKRRRGEEVSEWRIVLCPTGFGRESEQSSIAL